MASGNPTRRIATDGEPALGAHLVTQRRGYTHHGIYAGGGWVIHYAGWSRALHRGPVQQVTLAQFAAGRQLWVEHGELRYAADEVVRRARSRLGEDRYSLASNNCEHFCTWCRRGESRSEQVERWLAWPRRVLNAALGALPLPSGTPRAA
ncbi:MAG TPA: lecithin retinol acyltransferase family protein [Albitalea sp.]|nr:lecithin retinol acyltransferase family protein [Albitalea sp.]